MRISQYATLMHIGVANVSIAFVNSMSALCGHDSCDSDTAYNSSGHESNLAITGGIFLSKILRMHKLSTQIVSSADSVGRESLLLPSTVLGTIG